MVIVVSGWKEIGNEQLNLASSNPNLIKLYHH